MTSDAQGGPRSIDHMFGKLHCFCKQDICKARQTNTSDAT